MQSIEKKEIATHHKVSFSQVLMVGGIALLCAGLSLFILTFFPVIHQEVKYRLSSNTTLPNKLIKPIDSEFGIVIPKIKANTKVVAEVSPYDEKVYQRALTKGVAMAQGTVYPGQTGNTFIFAHSAGNWYIANQYNAVFYLLYKLEKGDEIVLYYKNKPFVYKVRELKYVDATDTRYLSATTDGWKTLTLMTCWPPGTTLKRLIVVADMVSY